MRFLHAADIHLDSPLRGLSRYDGAPVSALRGATRQALVNMVDGALEHQVDLVVLAGDLYDGDWPDYNTGLFFASQMARLERANIPVVAICGNHDAQSRLTKGLMLPGNFKMLSVDEPETYRLADLGVAVHGQGFREASVTDDISRAYPKPLAGHFNIGLLHTSADGRPGHANYAPCSVDYLKNLGYDYWALGHIHLREVLCSEPPIVFPGNLQGRHARETGVKGATLVEVKDGRVSSLTHMPCDVVRWHQLVVDVTGAESAEEVSQRVLTQMEQCVDQSAGRIAAVRVVTVGQGQAHSQLAGDQEKWINEIRALAFQVGSESVWVEKVKFASRAEPGRDTLAAQQDAFAAILEGVERLTRDRERLSVLGQELFSQLEAKLPREWKDELEGGIDPTSADVLLEALTDVPHLLASRLATASEQ